VFGPGTVGECPWAMGPGSTVVNAPTVRQGRLTHQPGALPTSNLRKRAHGCPLCQSAPHLPLPPSLERVETTNGPSRPVRVRRVTATVPAASGPAGAAGPE